MAGTKTKELIKFDVLNRFSGAVQFTAKIECKPDELQSVKLGLAVKWAIKARADLAYAYLAYADLAGANLTGANLAGANLTDAYLAGANLTGANIAGANLTGANLAGANLADANLTDAYLAGANLARANLAGANGAELAISRTRILPEGDLIGWKKCKNDVIVKLRIPADAKRSHAFGRKCRAEFVDVLEVIGAEIGITSGHVSETHYRVGERVKPDSFDDNWKNECSNGIHFWITREEAEAY